MLTDMDSTGNLASLPRGTCPFCMGSIPLKDINLAKPFHCPHCRRCMQTTVLFRVVKYLASYGISAVIVYPLHMAPWMSVLVWLVLSFLVGVLYYSILLMFFPAPSLILHQDRDFQKLDLNK
jgi:hypothetical protein